MSFWVVILLFCCLLYFCIFCLFAFFVLIVFLSFVSLSFCLFDTLTDLPGLVQEVGIIIFLGTILFIYSFHSFQVVFVLDYTPKFIVPPIVYEKVNLIQKLCMMHNKELKIFVAGGFPDEQSETRLVC